MPLDHAHGSDRSSVSALCSRRLLALVVCAFFLASPLIAIIPSASSDPSPGINPDMTRTLSWNFSNPANYLTSNALVSGGCGKLQYNNETVLENTQAAYAQGVRRDNVDISTVRDSVILNQSNRTVYSVTIQPGFSTGMDTYLRQDQANTNYGNSNTINFDCRNTRQQRPILEFDLSTIPADAVVRNATLFLSLTNGRGNDFQFNIYALNTSWVETQATWSVASTGNPWTLGGSYNSFSFYRGVMDNSIGWHSFDITRLVDLWLGGGLQNYGMILVPDNGDNTNCLKNLVSSDELFSVTERPKLVVNYTRPSLAGTYESRAIGPGTNSLFTLASCWNTTYSGLTDDFNGSSLLPNWSWNNKPVAGGAGYDVGVTRSGWLHITGEGNRNLGSTTIGANYLYENVTGSFRSRTMVNTSFSANTMGAGILLVDDDMNWASFCLYGTRANATLIVQVTEFGVTTTIASLAWSNDTDAHLGLDRVNNTIWFNYSNDGVTWNLLTSYAPPLPFSKRMMLGVCVYSGNSPANPVADFDFFRVLPVGNPVSMEVSARLGNSTSLTDPSWEAWGAPLPLNMSSVLGRTAMYIQYRVALSTVVDWVSPQFSGFQCHYERYSSDGAIFTQDQAVSHLKRWLTITTTEQLLGGTISYSYSVDHGVTWTPILPGSNSIADTAPFMMVRAAIHTPDTLSSPKVDMIVAQYAVAPSSFYMVTPASVVAGEQFSFTLESKDESNSTIQHWTGNVDLRAMDESGASQATSDLAIKSAWISFMGSVIVTNEVYTVAETIRIMASADGAYGLSEPIVVLPAMLAAVNITPSVTTVPEFSDQHYMAMGYDVYGNPIQDLICDWTASPDIGTLNTTTGTYVSLATGAGRHEGYLTATNSSISGMLFIRVVPPMYPPVFTKSIPDQVKDEDFGTWTLNISTFVSDVEDKWIDMRWYTTNESLISVVGENKTGDMEIDFATKKDLWGTDVLQLVVVDSDGMSSSTTITIIINPINDAPTIDRISPLVVKHDVDYAYDFRYYVHDVDTPYENLSLRVDEASALYTSVRWLTIVFNYPLALNGTTQYVIVTVSDGELSASTVVIVTVTNDNVPDSQRLPDLTLNQGESRLGYFDLDKYFTDKDGDVLYYATGNQHVRVEIQSNHTVDFYAPRNWWGQEYVIFIATDPLGARAEEAMSVTVLHVNQPPTISGVPDLSVRFEDRYDFDLSPYVSDPDNPIDTLSITTNDTHIAVMGATISLFYPQSMNGSRMPVMITVSDGALTDSLTIHVTVCDDYPPYVRAPPNSPPDHSFLEDAETPYPVLASLENFFGDNAGSDVLTFYAFTSSPNVTATAVQIVPANWSITFDADPDYNGNSNLTIRAMDPDGGIAECTVSLEVIPVPDAPKLKILPRNRTIYEGTQIAIDLSRNVTDPDIEDTQFVFQAISEYVPSYIKMTGSVLVLEFKDFLGSAEKSRTFNVTIRVTDPSGLQDSDVLTITVVKAPKEKVAENPWLYVGMIAMGGTTFGLFMVALRRRKKPFVVRDMMLIHNDGFLISRLAHPGEGEIDQDILSGMLTAVLNFVEDSMGTGAESLKTFGFKEYQVVVSRGQKVFAAVVYEGDMPDEIDRPMKEFIHTVERVYRKKLANWTGDIETDFTGVEVLIQAFVKENSRHHKAGRGEGIWKTRLGRADARPKKVTVNNITQEKVDRREAMVEQEKGK